MEFDDLVRKRRMTRAFANESVDAAVVDRILDAARRGPSAGNTASIEFLVLEGPDQTGRYWDTTLPADRRSSFPWPELLNAPVLIIAWVTPDAYVQRYAEPDKQQTGLGASADAWSVPYWFIDGGAAAMTLLLAAENEGLGALLFGLFEHEENVRAEFSVPVDRRAIGAIAIGRPAPDRPSRSAGRKRRPLAEIVHRGVW